MLPYIVLAPASRRSGPAPGPASHHSRRESGGILLSAYRRELACAAVTVQAESPTNYDPQALACPRAAGEHELGSPGRTIPRPGTGPCDHKPPPARQVSPLDFALGCFPQITTDDLRARSFPPRPSLSAVTAVLLWF